MVPFAAGEHVESTAEYEVTHAVESKPEEHVSHVRYLSCAHIFVDAVFQLIN